MVELKVIIAYPDPARQERFNRSMVELKDLPFCVQIPCRIELQSVYGRIERVFDDRRILAWLWLQSVYGRIERSDTLASSSANTWLQSVYGRIERSDAETCVIEYSRASIGLW